MAKYYPVIGIEIHIELESKSKMFCSCKNETFNVEPNVNICPICTAQPGTLPVANIEGIRKAYKAALAFNCKIPKEFRFERKNYFYPDLPKGYQLTSAHYPQGIKGYIEFEDKSGDYHKVNLDHLHLEEDAGKLIHDERGGNTTLVDLNRAGVPLLEIVSDALTEDITDIKTAVAYAKAVRQLARAMEISQVNMHKGEMRFDLNISLKKEGSREFGERCEIKNLNSFKALEEAGKKEIERQKEMLKEGKKITMTTLGYSLATGELTIQREKEGEADYRYFPEPNIPPIRLDAKEYGLPINIDILQKKLPERPYNKLKRFLKEFFISHDNADILTKEKKISDFFEETCSELKANPHDKKANKKLSEEELKKAYKLVSNYIITELLKTKDEDDENSIEDNFRGKMTAENFAELIKYTVNKMINSSITQKVLYEMVKTGIDPSHYLDENKLWQQNDEGSLKEIIKKVIRNNDKAVEDFNKGKETAVKFLVGQVMRETRGQANPQVAEKMLIEELKK